ncbi:hypothetical protein Chor_009645 [Crotalus horridus]
MDFLLSGVAACGACLFTNPLEVVKTRMQLQGELRAPGTYTRHYRNVFHAFYTIGRVDGLAALQRGLSPALFYQFGFNGIRLGTYGMAESEGYIHNRDGRISPLRATLAGALAGAASAIVSSPLYLGMFHALCGIHKEHGVLGLWRGAISSVPRVMVGSSTQLSTFSFSKQFFNHLEVRWVPVQESLFEKVFPKESWLIALCAGMTSSFMVAIAMTPFDVASTRLYNQPVGPDGQGMMYKGLLDCLAKIIQTEGFWGAYKGMGASYFRIGPHTILSLLFWDQIRQVNLRWPQE